MDISPKTVKHLKRHVKSYMPRIPYYVCNMAKSKVHPERGRMIYNEAYTTEHLRYFLDDPKMVPITGTITSKWVGTSVRLYTVENGRAMTTTCWKDVVKGARIEEGDICMFCFYHGGPAMGCFVARLTK
ncbi:unnamed protein product [Alopecurus aequalis]